MCAKVHHPPAPTAGPGSAFAGTSLAGRARRVNAKVASDVDKSTALTPNENDSMDWTESDEGDTVCVPKPATMTPVSYITAPLSGKHRRVLGIDTRYMSTPDTESVAQQYLDGCQSLVASLERRGLLPDYLAYTIPNAKALDSPSRRVGYKLRIWRLAENSGRCSDVVFPGVPLASQKADGASHEWAVSPELRASRSWKLFTNIGT
jgi:hypothetical protein